jgi:hypothetical protein
VIVLGLWMLWVQRDLVALAMGEAGEPGDGTRRADAPTRGITTTRMVVGTASLWSGTATDSAKSMPTG